MAALVLMEKLRALFSGHSSQGTTVAGLQKHISSDSQDQFLDIVLVPYMDLIIL